MGDRPHDVVGGDLEWGVRASFRSYIVGPIAHGAIAVDGGAAVADDGTFTFPAAGGETGPDTVDARFAGLVHFTGHEGVGTPPGVPALDMEVSDLRVVVDGQDGRLYADVTSRGLASGALTTYEDVHFADLDLSAVPATPVAGGLRWAGVPTTLTEDGVPAFADFYAAGDALDPVSFTLLLADEPPAGRTATESFVTAAHTDFLGTADPDAVAADVAALDGGQSRATFLRRLSTSDAWLDAVVARLYQDTLGRDGSADEVAYWTGRLRTGWSVAKVAASFYAAAEYHAGIGGGTDASWVADLYDKVLLRPASGDDVQYWTGQIASGGRGRVALRIYQSPESARTRVGQLYQALLGRPADDGGLDYWAGRVVVEGDLALAVHLAASGEYTARALARFP